MTQNKQIVPVLLCGGAGTRLWPASREALPKQFIPLIGSCSTFHMTLERVSGGRFSEPLVVTNDDYRFLVEAQMREANRPGSVLLEPVRRDSGPAILAAAHYVKNTLPNALALVLAADHLINDIEGFLAAVDTAVQSASGGSIVTFGMIPDRPHTGYGYISPGEALSDGVRKIARFVEKPDAATAARYIGEGYLWNSGMFLFDPAIMLAEAAIHAPDMVGPTGEAVAKAKRDLGFIRLDEASFSQAPKRSIDYAVMEKTSAAAVVPAAFGWSDVGNWQAVWEASPQDENGNHLVGPAMAIDSRNCLVRSTDQLAVVVGLENVVVDVEGDAVIVLDRTKSEMVKAVVETLKAEKHPSVTSSRRVYRPWGYYQTLDLGERFQVKRIMVKAGAKLSLQSHMHRAEHWVVVKGTALVTRDNDDIILRENESIYLPLGVRHRLTNSGRIPLELIEVQTGSYLGEDDIIRYEDVYNRH